MPKSLAHFRLLSIFRLLFVALTCTLALAQNTPVQLAPLPILQFFDQNGAPLAAGCLFSYQAGTTTPLSTYTDSTGTVANPNPLILDAAGRATGNGSGVWLLGQPYKLALSAAGGVNCATGQPQWTVDNVPSGVAGNLLSTQGQKSAIVGNGSEQSVFSFQIPANTVKALKGIRFRIVFQHSAGTGVVTYKTHLNCVIGGSCDSAFDSFASTQTSNSTFYYELFNVSGQTTQYIFVQRTMGSNGITNTSYGNPANVADFSQPLNFNFTFTAPNTETVIPMFFFMELIR